VRLLAKSLSSGYKNHAITKDTIVLADFTNNTGDGTIHDIGEESGEAFIVKHSQKNLEW